MYSTCRNPSLSLGYGAPHSLSFNDYYSSCFLDDRLGKYPAPSCCCCCSNSNSNSVYRLPINPSLLYGLRQSTLIQCSPSRRLILNVRNQSFSRFSVSGFEGKYASFKERGGGRKVRGRWGKGRYGCMVYDDDYSGDVDDEVEMMLSLLTEEVGHKCFGVRERNGSSWSLQVENQERENSDGISYRSGKKNVGSVGWENTSKRDQDYNVARYREKIKRQKENRTEERENISRCENCRVRIEGTSTKSSQAYDIALHKTQKKDRREEGMENILRSENRRVRREEGSSSKSDQAYDMSQYKAWIEERKEEGMENISVSEKRVRKEGSNWKSDQEYDSARYREEIIRHKDDRREEEKQHIQTSDYQKARKEGSNLRIEQEYDTARYQEEIKRHKEDKREGERENLVRSENHRLRKEGSSCSSYYSVSSAGEFESDTELQVKDDRIVGQSSSEYRREQKKNEDVRYDAEVREKVERHGDYVTEHGILMKKEYNAEGFYGESTGVERDWRKKSEKKLNEVIIEHSESKKKLAEERVRLSKIKHTSYERSSDFQQQYDDRKEKSALAMNINEGTIQHHSLNDDEIIGQSESRIKYKQFTGMPRSHSTVVEATSGSQKRYSDVDKNESISVSLVQETKGEHCETVGRVARQDADKRDSQQIAKVSEIQEIDKKGASSSLSETRMKNLEDNSTMLIRLVNDKEENQKKTGQLVSRQMGSQIKSHQMTGISETEDLDSESTSLSRTKADIKIKQKEKSELAYVEAKVTDTHRDSEESTSRQEGYSTSVVEGNVGDTQRVSQTSTDRQERFSTSVIKGEVTDTRRVSQDSTNQQERYLTSVAEGEVTDTQRFSEKSSNRHEGSSTSVVEATEKTRERLSLVDKGVLQIEPRKGTRRPVKAASFNEGMPKEVSGTYKSLKLIPESIVQKIGDNDNDKRSSEPIVMPPLDIESTSKFSSESLRSGLSELPVQREASSPPPGSDIYGGNRRGDSVGEPSDFIFHEDALGSADRLQQSSTQFVHEFVEKVRHEVSTSEGQKEEKMHETQFAQKNEEDKQKSVGQDGLGDSRRSSRVSGAKGPSDEMWHVADQSIQGPPKIEAAPESTVNTSESRVVKRTGRSMWNVIGDVVLMRWAYSRSETHTSKLGGKSSPNQSTDSEAWFSGHEADENNDENLKRENTVPKETSSSEKQQSGGIPSETQELSSPISLRSNIKHAGVDSSSFLSTESGSALNGGSLPSLQGTSSGTGIVEPSLPLPAIRMRRSPAVKDTSGASKPDASGSGKTEIEQAVPVHLPEESVAEAKDVNFKRRKFRRSDHVLKDRFDEWEEAHTLETEQRKIDEMFMREALLEARKGADMWEVPVGAVLVQHGKIIARGYNLVEDLRDSTAHAEMICIREASNVLRTWRLSETTLYVTLEPCPMCAGAILQARIDTVVWGAPNKLLGADGSWIRLFPNGCGGNDMELGDKAAAGPVHPFHPNIMIRRGILSSECADVMQQFFQLRRKKKTEQVPTPPSSSLPVSTHPSKFLTKMHEAFHIMFCL